jgi:hypothetical protein
VHFRHPIGFDPQMLKSPYNIERGRRVRII